MSDNSGFPPPPEQPERKPDQPGDQPFVPPAPPQYSGTPQPAASTQPETQQYPGYQQSNQPGGFPEAPKAPVGKGLAITALVLGIVALVFCWLPFLGIPVGIAAIIVGIIGMTRKGASKPMPLIGAILGGLGLVLSIIVIIVAAVFVNSLSGGASSAAAAYSSAVAGLETPASPAASSPAAEQSAPASSAAANGARTVKYVVTSSGPGKADYTTENGSSNAPVNGSWEKEITMNGKFLLTALTITADDVMANTELSCEIFIDGKSVSKKTGTSLVICSGTTS